MLSEEGAKTTTKFNELVTRAEQVASDMSPPSPSHLPKKFYNTLYFHSHSKAREGERPPEPKPDYDDEDSDRKLSAVSIESSADLQVIVWCVPHTNTQYSFDCINVCIFICLTELQCKTQYRPRFTLECIT